MILDSDVQFAQSFAKRPKYELTPLDQQHGTITTHQEPREIILN